MVCDGSYACLLTANMTQQELCPALSLVYSALLAALGMGPAWMVEITSRFCDNVTGFL